jgi:short-subunit dehydrogenase
MNIKNKVVIVTGASGGIGEATTRLFTRKGARVVLAARNKEKLQKLGRELKNSYVIVCDMSNEKSIKQMIIKTKKHFRRIDILINNAGQGYDAPVEKTDMKIVQKIFNLDVAGPLLAMQAVIPVMKKLGGGAIVNVSSGTALMALPNMGVYSSMKRALAGLSLAAREELKKDNIKVSVVYPYVTETNFEKNTIRWQKHEWTGKLPHPADSAEFAAAKILEAVETGNAEILAHKWMKKE